MVLKEYRHKASNRYFYTSRINDRSLLDTKYASLFEVTGNEITLKAAQDSGFSPVYRLFNKDGFHLYTADRTEQAPLLTDIRWQDEGIEGYAININPNASCPMSPAPTLAVKRLFHAASSKYRLVLDLALVNQLVSQGYVDKGIVFCAVDASTVIVTPPVVITPPITSSCGSLPTGYPANICEGFYRSTGNAQVVNYCDCLGNISPPPPTSNASCTLGATTIAHGAPVTAYQAASVTAPATCQSQAKICNNGVLTATTRTSENFTQASCSVVTPIIVPPAGSVTCRISQRIRHTRTMDGLTPEVLLAKEPFTIWDKLLHRSK